MVCLCPLLSILMANSLHSLDANNPSALHYPPAAGPDHDKPDMQLLAHAQETPNHLQFPDKCDLKIQVIDDTALIEPSAAVSGNLTVKEKKPKRRVRKTRKKKEVLEKKGKECVAVMYSRKEMEALRFERFEDQKRKWIDVYASFDPTVAEEYDGLVDSAANNNPNHHHHPKNCVPNLNFDARPPMQKSANLFAVAAMVKANPLIITAH